MNKVMDIIKGKCIDERMQDSVNRAVNFSGGNIPQETIDASVKDMLEIEMTMNNDFKDAFAEYAYDLAMNNILKELGIKYNPESAKNHIGCDPRFNIAAMLAKVLCR